MRQQNGNWLGNGRLVVIIPGLFGPWEYMEVILQVYFSNSFNVLEF